MQIIQSTLKLIPLKLPTEVARVSKAIPVYTVVNKDINYLDSKKQRLV